ncbi:MAG: hypothetical protein JJE55_09145 [Flavobacteriaceae bacterium]|nr:hypothetical protein [Flavobacteriaceae bacterium]
MAKENNFEERKIALKDLNLWSENPRFPEAYFGKPENELIDYIVSIPHYKIKEFGKEVVEDFDMPVFEKLAIYNDNGEFIAYEGNRRLTVYKLLLNPNITSDINVSDYFTQLKRLINIDEDFKIDCVISENPKEILRYVNRKHLNNNNEVNWGSIENSNAKLRWLENPMKQDIFQSNLSVIIRNMDLPESIKNQILGKGYVTTLFRTINSTTAAKFFSLTFDDDNNLISGNKDFTNKLEIIIYDIIAGKVFNGKIFSRLNKVDIDKYLNTLVLKKVDSNSDKKKTNQKEHIVEKKIEGNIKKLDNDGEDISKVVNTNKGTSGAILPDKKNKLKRKSTSRTRLIPKSCKLNIKNNKVNNIFRELRDDLLLSDSTKSVPNAVGVLFRVFLEVTLDEYAEKKHGHNFKKDSGISSKIEWVVDKLISLGYPNKLFSVINSVGSSKKQYTYLSIEKFHEYVHSNTLEPSSSELKTKWDLLEPFFVIIYYELNKDS